MKRGGLERVCTLGSPPTLAEREVQLDNSNQSTMAKQTNKKQTNLTNQSILAISRSSSALLLSYPP